MPSPQVLESVLLSLFIRVAERNTKCSLRYYNGATRGPGWLQTHLASPKDETECSRFCEMTQLPSSATK